MFIERIRQIVGEHVERLRKDPFQAVMASALRAIRAALIDGEVRSADADQFVRRALEAFPSGETQGTEQFADVLWDALFEIEDLHRYALLAEVPNPKRPASTKAAWDLKELANRMGESRAAKAFPGYRRPKNDRRPQHTVGADTIRDARRGATHTISREQKEACVDPSTVAKCLRVLGHDTRDFGPEPPSGGRPALI